MCEQKNLELLSLKPKRLFEHKKTQVPCQQRMKKGFSSKCDGLSDIQTNYYLRSNGAVEMRSIYNLKESSSISFQNLLIRSPEINLLFEPK
mmetsp:Transcript_2287/g.4832  ORF Transcript_2287/g.4832 Transcript_2287/m.4832 type:complete len:91 (+) Transcript_2287:1245-1517(+)